MPREGFTKLDHVIFALLFENNSFFQKDSKKYLQLVLNDINAAYRHIIKAGMEKFKKEGGEIPDLNDDVKHKILTRAIYESVNRNIYSVVRDTMLSSQKALSQAGTLFANPQGLNQAIGNG